MGAVVAKLIIEDKVERELSYVEMDYRRGTRWYGMPCTPPMGGLITVAFTSQRDDDYFLDWMFANRIGNKNVASIHQFYTIKKGAVIFYEEDYDGVILDRYRFEDCTPIYYREVFSNLHGMVVIMTLSAAIQKYRFQLFVKQWHESWRPPEEYKPPILDVAPRLTSVDWVDKDKQPINETPYDSKVGLRLDFLNQEGGTVSVKIKKKDGSKFDDNTEEITFEESVNGNSLFIRNAEIKAHWEDFKSAEIDELVATATYKSSPKQSKPLKIIPTPKVTLHFRPHSEWRGEFGFDWMRIEDTDIDGDVDYEQNVGEYEAIYATKPGAIFTPKDYSVLENEYTHINLNGKKDASGNPVQYYTPSLSIYRAPNVAIPPYAKLELQTEVEVAPDELFIEFPKKYFDIDGAVDSPKDASLKRYNLSEAMKGKTNAGTPNKTDIQLKCIHTLPNDEIIKVWAANRKEDGTLNTPILSGQLKVKANNKAHRRIAKIVFVNVKTDINSNNSNGIDGISTSDKVTQENNLTPFLKQALIKPEIANEDLKLFDSNKTEVQTLNKDYTLSVGRTKIFNKYSNSGGVNLATFLNQQFNAKPEFAKYSNYYKVFFLGERGGRSKNNGDIVGLGGHANGIPSKECVMYANPMPFFVAHELMHCMGLYHSFDNKAKHTFKIGQTENIMDYSHISTYATPNGTLTQISTWQWQWKTLKNNNENEP